MGDAIHKLRQNYERQLNNIRELREKIHRNRVEKELALTEFKEATIAGLDVDEIQVQHRGV